MAYKTNAQLDKNAADRYNRSQAYFSLACLCVVYLSLAVASCCIVTN